MKFRPFILAPLAMLLIFSFTIPAYAFSSGAGVPGSAGIGAGVMFPDIEGVETDNSIYYLFDYISMDYLFEINYFNDDDMDGWMIHGDYLYPITGAMDNEVYIGGGYSYVFGNSDALGDDNAFNICIGINALEKLDIRGRYLFLGGGDNIFSIGGSYFF